MILPSSDEYLEVMGESASSIPLHTEAWLIEDLSPLWQRAQKRGGEGITIPGARGRRSVPAEYDETDYVLPFVVLAAVDHEGNPPTLSARGTLNRSIRFLQDELETPANTPGGDRASTLHGPDGATAVGEIKIMRFSFGALGPVAVRGALTVRIPAGHLDWQDDAS